MDAPPFTELEKSIRETWFNLNEPNFKIFFYYGNHDKNEIIGDKILTDSGEGLYNIGHKTIKMFEEIYNNFDFDYIFRTNLSSYVDIKRLKEFLLDKPKNNFYCGSFGEHAGIPFCSGSGYFISKDLVELVIKHKSEWDHSFIDDVSLGLLLHNMGVQRTLGRRFDFGSGANLDLSVYHYRCKTDDPSRFGCIHNMKHIYNLKK
jgi:hypothetical protein